MLPDFYPRLSAAAGDDEECTSLINQQIEVGLLLAEPRILLSIHRQGIERKMAHAGKHLLEKRQSTTGAQVLWKAMIYPSPKLLVKYLGAFLPQDMAALVIRKNDIVPGDEGNLP